jgi:hypothetical protein
MFLELVVVDERKGIDKFVSGIESRQPEFYVGR